MEKIDGGWRYDEPSGLRLDFDEAGALVELVQASERLRLAREGGQVRVSHNRYPGTFSFAEDDRQQPLRLTAPGLAVLYNYEGGHLIRVARDAAGQASEQRYHYEDPRNPRLLTGITDNRGVRFATWRYDERAELCPANTPTARRRSASPTTSMAPPLSPTNTASRLPTASR